MSKLIDSPEFALSQFRNLFTGAGPSANMGIKLLYTPETYQEGKALLNRAAEIIERYALPLVVLGYTENAYMYISVTFQNN